MALFGAGMGVVLLAATWYLFHYVPIFRRADVSILSGFVQLDRPRLDRLTNFVAGLCDPQRYVFLAVIPVAVALFRRRVRLAVMIAVVLLCANETTQLLKPLLAAPRDPVWWSPITTASWPSGHATASMTLALMIVISAPARRRPVVAAGAAAFALAVCYSFLELGWHYPSDVFGGYLVAATWTMLGIAGVTLYEARRSRAAAAGVVTVGLAGAQAAAGGAGGSRAGAPAVGGSRSPASAGPRAAGASVTVAQALAPMAALLVLAGVAVALVVLLRPHEVLSYARDHGAFVIGASAIAVLGLMLASGLTLMLRRPS